MDKIAIVGTGNVGTHLYRAMCAHGLQVDIFKARGLKSFNNNYNMIIIATKDSFIEYTASEIGNLLPEFNGIVIHCAGSISSDILSGYFKYYGVMYPLQTFSKDIPIKNYSEIPIFIEGNTELVKIKLLTIASKISHHVLPLDSERRLKLHIASVFISNFVNAIYLMAEELLNDSELSFDMMSKLIEQTTEKAIYYSPSLCQTGPAKRGDVEILEKHLHNLRKYPLHQAIYKMMSNYIFKKFNINNE